MARKKRIERTEVEHTTPAGGNVFLDLGFDPAEAEQLLQEADRIIEQKQAIKESLMGTVSVWIGENRLRQVDAAEILGVTRPRVSDVVKMKTAKFSIDSLIDMVAKTGKQIRVSVVNA